MLCLLAANAQEILIDVGLTTAIGLVVVFSVLLLLTGVFKVFGLAVSSASNKGETPNHSAPATAPAPVVAAPIVGNTQTVQSAPEIQNGIPAETVAVISAAVASVAPAGSQYAVRGIRKA